MPQQFGACNPEELYKALFRFQMFGKVTSTLRNVLTSVRTINLAENLLSDYCQLLFQTW